MTAEDTRLYSIRQAAEHWGQEPATVRQWVDRGHIRFIRVGSKCFIPGAEVGRIDRGEALDRPA